MAQKILVTGANGYIGTGVVKALLALKQNVIATDFNVDGIDSRAKAIAGNIFETENPYEYFRKPDVVLHLAWRNGFVHNADSHLGDLANHYNFLSKMADSGVKKIVALGSMHEIGFWEGRLIRFHFMVFLKMHCDSHWSFSANRKISFFSGFADIIL